MRNCPLPYGDRTVVFDRVNGLVEVPLQGGGQFVTDVDFVKWLARKAGHD